MLRQILRAVARGAAMDARNQAAGVGLLMLAALVGVLGAGFAFLAVFLGLTTVMPPWAAALIVAALIFLLAVIIWLIGKAQMRRPRIAASVVEQELGALTRQAGVMGKELGEKTGGVNLVVAAGLIGVILGQHLKK